MISFANNPSCLYPTYIKGQAYLASGQAANAATEFQKAMGAGGHHHLAARAAVTRWACAVSVYCWKPVILPPFKRQTWTTCASSTAPVALYEA
jgi:hypothetical protein